MKVFRNSLTIVFSAHFSQEELQDISDNSGCPRFTMVSGREIVPENEDEFEKLVDWWDNHLNT